MTEGAEVLQPGRQAHQFAELSQNQANGQETPPEWNVGPGDRCELHRLCSDEYGGGQVCHCGTDEQARRAAGNT